MHDPGPADPFPPGRPGRPHLLSYSRAGRQPRHHPAGLHAHLELLLRRWPPAPAAARRCRGRTPTRATGRPGSRCPARSRPLPRTAARTGASTARRTRRPARPGGRRPAARRRRCPSPVRSAGRPSGQVVERAEIDPVGGQRPRRRRGVRGAGGLRVGHVAADRRRARRRARARRRTAPGPAPRAPCPRATSEPTYSPSAGAVGGRVQRRRAGARPPPAPTSRPPRPAPWARRPRPRCRSATVAAGRSGGTASSRPADTHAPTGTCTSTGCSGWPSQVPCRKSLSAWGRSTPWTARRTGSIALSNVATSATRSRIPIRLMTGPLPPPATRRLPRRSSLSQVNVSQATGNCRVSAGMFRADNRWHEEEP